MFLRPPLGTSPGPGLAPGSGLLSKPVPSSSPRSGSRPRPRVSSVATCAACATELEALEAGAWGGHVCTHQQVAEDAEIDTVSQAGSDRAVAPRGGKHRQPDENVIQQYVDAMVLKLDILVQTVAVLLPLLEEEEEERYEQHLIDWSNYCEDVKDRARDVIKLLRTAAQVEKDRRFAMNIAREEGKDDERQDDGNDGAPGGGDREEVVPAAGSLIGQPGASSKSPPVIQTSPSPVPTVPQSST